MTAPPIAAYSLSDLLIDLETEMIRAAEHKGIHYSHRYLGRIPDGVTGDAEQLRNQLKPLILRSIERLTQGFIEVAIRSENSRLFLTLRESGAFSEEDAPPAQIESSLLTVSTKADSTLHGRIVEISFAVTPADSAHPVEHRAPSVLADASQTSDQPLLGKKLLVAEDSADLRFLYTRLLRMAGAEVAMAADGAEALQAVSREAFDVILMDVEMSPMNGLVATAQLRAKGYDKPILALTAHNLSEDRQRILAAGCDDHLTKPIIRPVFLRAILKALLPKN